MNLKNAHSGDCNCKAKRKKLSNPSFWCFRRPSPKVSKKPEEHFGIIRANTTVWQSSEGKEPRCISLSFLQDDPRVYPTGKFLSPQHLLPHNSIISLFATEVETSSTAAKQKCIFLHLDLSSCSHLFHPHPEPLKEPRILMPRGILVDGFCYWPHTAPT